MFEKYNRNTFDRIREQHNIMVLVGNGFDVAILNKYNTGSLRGKTSTYKDFYEYLRYFHLCDENNILFKRMTRDLLDGKENWCDFEETISKLVEDRSVKIEELEKCVDEFQAYFTSFLNKLVDSSVLLEMNADVKNKALAIQSLSHFMKDLPDNCGIEFPTMTYHYDLYNFLFVDFCYTSLLDNYMYLDKGQFEPHALKNADRHFGFYPETALSLNPTRYSSYLVTNVIHPHGIQDVPRSILFGIDIPDFNKGTSKEKRLIKSYWSRYEVRYKSYFEEVKLFIMYGMSIAKTDGWWVDQIFDSIINNRAELIIYKYGCESEESIKDQFVKACIRHKYAEEIDIEYVKKHIYVVTFMTNDTYFLGLEKKEDKLDKRKKVTK